MEAVPVRRLGFGEQVLPHVLACEPPLPTAFYKNLQKKPPDSGGAVSESAKKRRFCGCGLISRTHLSHSPFSRAFRDRVKSSFCCWLERYATESWFKGQRGGVKAAKN
jgi:hypothetical protein